MQKDFDRWNGKKKTLDSRVSNVDFHEREIWWCSIGVNVGSEQLSQTEDFSRPVVVVRRFTRDIFWGVPLTTKTKERFQFRFKLIVGNNVNDALVLQMRSYDRRRLVRKVGVVPEKIFVALITTIVDAIKTTNPALAGLSEAEANVYDEGYTNQSKKSTKDSEGGDNEKSL